MKKKREGKSQQTKVFMLAHRTGLHDRECRIGTRTAEGGAGGVRVWRRTRILVVFIYQALDPYGEFCKDWEARRLVQRAVRAVWYGAVL